MADSFQRPDAVNTPASVFNEQQQLWNNDNANLTLTFGTYSRLPSEQQRANPADSAIPETLRIPGQKTGAVESDFESSQVQVNQEQSTDIPTVPIVAPFAMNRALTTLDMHRAGFWTTSAAIEAIAGSNNPDPTPAELDRKWEALQAFMYLPPDIAPSQADFKALASPSLRATYVRGQLAKLGIVVSSALNAPTPKVSLQQMMADATAQSPTNINATFTPYAETLGRFCKLQASSDTPAMTAAEAFNNAANKGGPTPR
jgi:hypothetical protein